MTTSGVAEFDASLWQDLTNYDFKPGFGFMREAPLERLPEYFDPWEDLLKKMPELLKRDEDEPQRTNYVGEDFYAEVAKMPLLDPAKLSDSNLISRGMLVISLLGHGFMFGDYRRKIVHAEIPPNIAIPWVLIAHRLQRPPIISHDSLNLSNYKFARSDIDPTKEKIFTEDLIKLDGFLDDYSEDWFYLVTSELEFRGSALPFWFRRIHEGILQKKLDAGEIVASLNKVYLLLEEINRVILKMFEKCDPTIFYHKLRPFLNGSKNNSLAPQGVLLQMNITTQDAEEQRIARSVPHELKEKYSSPTFYHGGSAGQSSLIASIDTFFAVEHTGPESKPFMNAMREYMPKPHRSLLEVLDRNRHVLKDYINENRDKPELTEVYNKCVEQFTEFRSKHLQIVARYIVNPARATGTPVSGTGGSSAVPFLKSVRDETRESMIK
jgi:indoleamine 2,3-dioxygenase